MCSIIEVVPMNLCLFFRSRYPCADTGSDIYNRQHNSPLMPPLQWSMRFTTILSETVNLTAYIYIMPCRRYAWPVYGFPSVAQRQCSYRYGYGLLHFEYRSKKARPVIVRLKCISGIYHEDRSRMCRISRRRPRYTTTPPPCTNKIR